MLLAALAAVGWALAATGALLALRHRSEIAARRELVSRACHELRRPLTAARLSLATIERRAEAPPERIATLDLELRRAGAALDDLSCARDGHRRTDLDEPVEVAELLEEQYDSWSAIAGAFHSTVALGPRLPGHMVHGDRLRLGQAVANLVANALEHGPGTIELSARETGPRTLCLEVIDEGPGLPLTLEELTRVPGRGSRGRGLAIAAEIAGRHGGRIATAPTARGTRIGIELPIVSRGGLR